MTKHPEIFLSVLGNGWNSIYAYFGAIESGLTPQQVELVSIDSIKTVDLDFLESAPISEVSPVEVSFQLIGEITTFFEKMWGSPEIETDALRIFSGGTSKYVDIKLYNPNTVKRKVLKTIPNQRALEDINESAVIKYAKTRKMVICTFPRTEIANAFRKHGFLIDFTVSISGTSKDEGNLVVYNGKNTVPWLRQIFRNRQVYTLYPYNLTTDQIIQLETDSGRPNPTIRKITEVHPNAPLYTKLPNNEPYNLIRIGKESLLDRAWKPHNARTEVSLFIDYLRYNFNVLRKEQDHEYV